MYQMMQGERERLIKRLGVYYRQHMSGQNRRKEMLAILVLLDRSTDETSETAQIGQDFEVEKHENVCIIKNDEFNESDHPRDENGQFTDGSGNISGEPSLSESASSNENTPSPESTLRIPGSRPINSDIIYNSYDFSNEKEEYSKMYPAEIRSKKAYNAENRARYRNNWAYQDMDKAIKDILPNPLVAPPNINGKIVFFSNETTKTVCFDLFGDYFTIIDTAIAGEASYLDINGNQVLNFVKPNGRISGRPKSDRRKITHFNRRK